MDIAQSIKDLPLSEAQQEDLLVWNGEHLGLYSIRSGYRLLIQPTVVNSYNGGAIHPKLCKRDWYLSRCLHHSKVYDNSVWVPPTDLAVKSVFTAEVLAVIQGLRFALDMGFQHIVLEGDSRSVIKKLNSLANDFSSIGSFTYDAKALAYHFHSSVFRFTSRGDNIVAHAMCCEGKESKEDNFWIEDTPRDVLAAVEEDMRHTDPP
ncbi:hypothetical protein F3Y22_tig00000991pilonHSYRG00126 [Hibiscus syriacus]|uniref:RNase H type-1 domain-containing protein n=1 Tax=Hibiscus syriacus TaxID=106335 RepID=A0A6A3CZ48_HIBSY|nr:hypothetical protein F3Y22_tig00000991pilonHSYRG00126 [Hibiscus syriacus]